MQQSGVSEKHSLLPKLIGAHQMVRQILVSTFRSPKSTVTYRIGVGYRAVL